MGAFTPLNSAIVNSIAAEYGLHVRAHHPMTGGIENTNVSLDAREGRFVLTVLEKKDLAAAAEYATYQRSLADAGLPVPRVIQRRAGGHVSCYFGKPVLVTEYVEGLCVAQFSGDLLFRAGEILGRVHAARDIRCALDPCLRLRAANLAEIRAFADTNFAEWILRRHQRVRYVVESGGPRVPTHGDLFPDNIIVRSDNDLVFIDWDDGSMDYPWIDIGMAILGLCCQQDFLPGHARLLLRGYQSASPHRLDLGVVRDAAIYVALCVGYNRYRRRGTSRSHADPHRSYSAIPGLLVSLQEQWSDVRV